MCGYWYWVEVSCETLYERIREGAEACFYTLALRLRKKGGD